MKRNGKAGRTGFFSGGVVNNCGSMCAAAIYKGADFTGGCTYQGVLGLCFSKHPLCAKALLSLFPLLPPVPLLCKGAAEGSLKAKPEMLQP